MNEDDDITVPAEVVTHVDHLVLNLDAMPDEAWDRLWSALEDID
jgi:hypothetical protein